MMLLTSNVACLCLPLMLLAVQHWWPNQLCRCRAEHAINRARLHGASRTASGLAIARRIFNPTPNHTMGIDQGKYEAKGNAWIRDNYAGTNFILGAAVTSAA
jgi:hypothetical protein